MIARDKAGGRVVAVVDDDMLTRRLLRGLLENAGYEVVEHETGRGILEVDSSTLSAVCLDLRLGDVPGMSVLAALQEKDAQLPILIITAVREFDSAVEAMKAGAYDYVVKPIEPDRLLPAVRRAVERRTLSQRVQRLERELSSPLVGHSAAMRELTLHIQRVAPSEVPVCVMGETGTGKELVARAIHMLSPRHGEAFVALNCAAITESLQESELFGHERGAFTGATGLRRGRFEEARRGTLFLDELGEMAAGTQASLLRTLQEKTIRRVGGSAEIPVDVRIVSATHRRLEGEVEAGRFRQDLYYRLVVYPIHVPPLRARKEDIPLLVGHFLAQAHKRGARLVERVSDEALAGLMAHDWPGNVRELENVVQRAILVCDGDELLPRHLPTALAPAAGSGARRRDTPPREARTLPALATELAAGESAAGDDEPIMPLRALERREIDKALRRTQGNMRLAAQLLGIGRATLYRRVAEYGLEVKTAEEPDDDPAES